MSFDFEKSRKDKIIYINTVVITIENKIFSKVLPFIISKNNKNFIKLSYLLSTKKLSIAK